MDTKNLFALALADLRTRGMMALVTIPFAISLVALILLYGGLVVWLLGALGSAASAWMPAWVLAIGEWPLIGPALGALFEIIVGLLVSLVGYFVISQLFVVTGLLIAGFFSGRIAARVHRNHYASLPLQQDQPVLPVFGAMLARVLGYGSLLVVTLPLLLIPGIGTLVVNAVLFLLFRSLLLLDVGTTILAPEDFRRLIRRQGGAWSSTGLLYLLSLIPLLNLAIPVFSVIVTSHLVFQRLAAGSAGQTVT